MDNIKIYDSQINNINNSAADDEDDDKGLFGKKETNKPIDSKSKTPILDSFSKDLTKYAEESKIDAIIGRDKEIERAAQILGRRKKNSVILLGQPGCVDGETLITVRKVSDCGTHNIVIEG